VLVQSLRFAQEGRELLTPTAADLRRQVWDAMSR